MFHVHESSKLMREVVVLHAHHVICVSTHHEGYLTLNSISGRSGCTGDVTLSVKTWVAVELPYACEKAIADAVR